MPQRRTTEDETLRSRIENVANRRAVVWLVVAYLIVMFVTMIWVSRVLDHSMRRLTGRAIGDILDGNVAKFRLHIVELQWAAERQFARPEFRSACLQAMQTEGRETDNSDPENNETVNLEAVSDLGSLIARAPETHAWVLLDAGARIVASDALDCVDRDCQWSDQNLSQLRDNRSTLVLPPASSMDAAHASPASGPHLLVLAPIVERKRLVGAFGWMIDPRDYLSEQFSVTDTDSTYLFDRQARILSRSRFDPRTLDSTNVPNDSTWTPVVLRDPGVETLSSPSLSRDELLQRPLTSMADRAIRGSSGIDTDGYNDYRGIPVVGAWQWLPDMNVAMAIEVDQSEAFGAVRMLQRLVAGLFLLLSLAGLGVAVLAIASARLRQRLKKRQQGTRRLGQYELTELLGAGGMGSVYRGRHQYLRRDVAIKVLEGDELTPTAVERFRREVQLTSTLRHPNTIAIYDYGQARRLFDADEVSVSQTNSVNGDSLDSDSLDADSVFYYVMEYVDGISLQQLMDYYGPQHPARVIHLLLQICGSITEAHDAGLIHRDIKPANILLSAQTNSWDFIKVLDFGLVKDLGRVDETVDLTMTRSDSITGTPLYMAPETIRDASAASKRGDLYSIGAVGYALLTGHTTYEGESAIDLCLKQLEQPPPRPDIRLGQMLPDELQDLIMNCLSLNPSVRPGSVNELVNRLDELPEAGRWNQADAAVWWETVFEANRQQTPVETKNPTLAGS